MSAGAGAPGARPCPSCPPMPPGYRPVSPPVARARNPCVYLKGLMKAAGAVRLAFRADAPIPPEDTSCVSFRRTYMMRDLAQNINEVKLPDGCRRTLGFRPQSSQRSKTSALERYRAAPKAGACPTAYDSSKIPSTLNAGRHWGAALALVAWPNSAKCAV
jgi:hypothetical protein